MDGKIEVRKSWSMKTKHNTHFLRSKLIIILRVEDIYCAEILYSTIQYNKIKSHILMIWMGIPKVSVNFLVTWC